MQLHVADVGNSGQIHNHALEAQAESGVAAGAVAPQVQIPPVILGVQAQLGHPRLQHIQPLLALGTADDLADSRHQAVSGGHGLAVVVQAHIERLDFLGIVGDKDRPLVHLLGQVALVLGLEVAAPLHLIVKLVVVLLENLHGLGVAHPAEVGGGHMLQPLLQALIHEGVEEVHLIGALVHDIADDILEHILRQIHVVVQIGEGDLRLDHPKFRSVALGVGVLRPEGGAEGVNTAEGHGEVLAVELAGDGQIGLFAEEVLGIIHLPVLGLGHVVQVQGSHLEHLTRALTVGGGDDGRVDIDKAPVLEEAVDGVGSHGAHPERGGEQVGAGPQMLDGAQVFHRMPLFLEGILRRGGALHRDGVRLDLQRLLGLGRQGDHARHDQGRAHILAGDLLIIGQLLRLHDDLKVFEAGAVVELDKPKGLHVPDGTGPAADRDLSAAERLLIGEDLGDSGSFHGVSLSLASFFRNPHYKWFPAILQPQLSGFSRLFPVSPAREPRFAYSLFQFFEISENFCRFGLQTIRNLSSLKSRFFRPA